MVNKIVATQADFERLADVLQDLASAEYLANRELSQKLVVMGRDPQVEGQLSFRAIAIADMVSERAGIPGELVLAALIEKLVTDPEVLVVGYMGEAWAAHYTLTERTQLGAEIHPEDAPNREEVLILNLRSAEVFAVKALPIHRDGQKTTMSPGKLMFKPQHEQPPSSHFIQ